MNLHYTLTDKQFVEDFEHCRLNPSWFNHEAHLRLAYIYIHNLGPRKAAEKVCESILQFDRVFGSGEKFHKTITIASIGVLSHFMGKAKSADFRSLINEFPQLKFEFKRLLLSHYSSRLLSDISSKTHYYQPDVLPDPVFGEIG